MQAALERTSKWYEHSSGSVPTNVRVACVARGSLSQWKEMRVDLRRGSGSVSLDFKERFEELTSHGDPFVYCRTSLLPRNVRFEDCCLQNN